MKRSRLALLWLLPLLGGCANLLLPSRVDSEGRDRDGRQEEDDEDDAGDDDGPRRDDEEEEEEEEEEVPPPDCGIHAEPNGQDCECVDRYSWCDASKTDCCAWDVSAYRLTIVSVFVMPFKDEGEGEPWDWDGDIPDWLIDAFSYLGYVIPEAATVAEVLDLIDEYAPELMEGYVPPDAFWELYDGDEVLDAGLTIDDAYDPYWGDTVRLSPGSRTEYTLFFYDEDLTFDDDVEGVLLTVADLAWLAGQGEFSVLHFGNLFELTIEIDPVW